jgi:hypothetical protein
MIHCQKNQALIASTFLEKSELDDAYSNFPLRAARVTVARVNGTTVHNASHPAAQLKTAAASRGQKLVRAAGSDSSPMTLTAALQM